MQISFARDVNAFWVSCLIAEGATKDLQMNELSLLLQVS